MDKRFRGTIVGLLNAFFAGSPSVFVQIYLHVLTGEGNIVESGVEHHKTKSNHQSNYYDIYIL
jgi:hypothetical protein